ncbi:MAG: flagellar hook-associated protein FlgL [Pseudomonadota bacterium]
MRISTNTMFEMGSARLSDLQTSLVKTQQQLSAGRRILTPADDPVGAARALEVTQAQSMVEQFATNRQYARNSLSQVETALTSVTGLLQDAKVLVVNAGNATLTDANRASLAIELRGRLDDLLGLANAGDGMGNHLFSGYQSGTAPFAATAGGAQYNGDQGQLLMQVSSSRQIAMSIPGKAIFQQNDGSLDVFKTFTDVIAALEAPAGPTLSASLASANANLDQSIDTVLNARASVGSRLKELDSLDSAGADLDVQYQQTLSDLQSLDYAKAISDLTQQQFTLEAAQKSFMIVSGMSLFKML